MLRVISWLTAALLLPVAAVTTAAPAQAAGPHLITVIAQSGAGVPVSGMSVELYYGGASVDPPAAGAYAQVATASTGSDGWATFTGRPDGYYKVRYAGTSTLAPVWWDGGSTLADADWFGAGELNPNPTIGPVTMDRLGSMSTGVKDQFGGGLPTSCYLQLGAQSYYLDFYGRQLSVTGLAPGAYSGPLSCPGGVSHTVAFTIGRSSLGQDADPELGEVTLSVPYAYSTQAEIAPPVGGFDTLPATVTGNPGTWDPIPRRFDFYWTVGGVTTASAYSSRSITEADRGKTVVFKACVFLSTTVCNTADPIVVPGGGAGPSAPANSAPPTITGPAVVGRTLTASTGVWTPASGLTFGYQWRLDGSPVVGATGPSYVVPPAAWTKTVSVLVTATDGSARTASAVSASTGAVARGSLTLDVAPTLAGIAKAGKRLKVRAGRTTPGVAPRFAWFVGSSMVPGATVASFTLKKKHVGKRIRVVVLYSLAGYTPREVSLRTGKVKPAGLKPAG